MQITQVSFRVKKLGKHEQTIIDAQKFTAKHHSEKRSKKSLREKYARNKSKRKHEKIVRNVLNEPSVAKSNRIWKYALKSRAYCYDRIAWQIIQTIPIFTVWENLLHKLATTDVTDKLFKLPLSIMQSLWETYSTQKDNIYS